MIIIQAVRVYSSELLLNVGELVSVSMDTERFISCYIFTLAFSSQTLTGMLTPSVLSLTRPISPGVLLSQVMLRTIPGAS